MPSTDLTAEQKAAVRYAVASLRKMIRVGDVEDYAQDAAIIAITFDGDPKHLNQHVRFRIIDKIRVDVRVNLYGSRNGNGTFIDGLRRQYSIDEEDEWFGFCDPTVSTEYSAHARLLAEKIDKLPHPFPLVARMIVEGYELSEIGDILGVTASRVCQHRNSLKALLKDEV